MHGNIIKQAGANNSQFGTIWICKGTENRKINSNDLDKYISLGFSKGRKLKESKLCIFCNIEPIRRQRNLFCSSECRNGAENKEFIRKILDNEILPHGKIRKYLIKIHNVCSECGINSVWNNKPLSFQLDHKDGNSDNTRYSNVRLLCPNCHTQTETWCSRNKKNTNRSKSLRRSYYKKRPASLTGKYLVYTE